MEVRQSFSEENSVYAATGRKCGYYLARLQVEKSVPVLDENTHEDPRMGERVAHLRRKSEVSKVEHRMRRTGRSLGLFLVLWETTDKFTWRLSSDI